MMRENGRRRPFLRPKRHGPRGRLAFLLFVLVASIVTLVLVAADDVIGSRSGRGRVGTALPTEDGPRRTPEPLVAGPVVPGEARAAAARNGETTVDAGQVRAELLDRFVALEQILAEGRGQSPEITGAIARISTLLRLVPGATEVVMDRLAEAACTDALASILTTCLSQAGTPTPQGGLRRILTEGQWNDTRRRMALFALVPIRKPIPELDDALLNLHDAGSTLARDALRVLAAVGDRIHDDEPQRFNRIRERLEIALQGADALGTLEILGNLGVGEVPPAFHEAVSDESEVTRVMAVLALTRIRSADADRLLAKAARDDPSAQVREAAQETLNERKALGLHG